MRITIQTVAIFGALCMAQASVAQTVVSSFAPSTNTDLGIWYENDVRIGGSAEVVDLTGLGGDLETNQPSAPSAALLTTDMTNEAKGEVAVLGDYGFPNDIFATLGVTYAYHKASNPGQNLAAAPALKLTFFNPVCDDMASLGDCYIQLVYEPTWNGGNPPLDTWTTVTIDENTGVFWSTGGFGSDNGAGGPPVLTLAQWQGTLSSDFGDSTLIRVSVGVGSFNQGQLGYFDAVGISHGFGPGLTESYRFDAAPVTPPGGPVSPGASPIPVPILPLPILALLCVIVASIGSRRLRNRLYF